MIFNDFLIDMLTTFQLNFSTNNCLSLLIYIKIESVKTRLAQSLLKNSIIQDTFIDLVYTVKSVGTRIKLVRTKHLIRLCLYRFI